MKKHFSIATLLNTWLILMLMAGCCLAVLLLLHSEYEKRKDALVRESLLLTRGDTLLQLAMSFRDRPQLETRLPEFFHSTAVRYVAFRDPSGQPLAVSDRTHGNRYATVDLESMRRGLESLELGEYVSGINPFAEHYLDLTVPVFARVDPLAGYVGNRDYNGALTNAGAAGSEILVGFLHLGVNLSALKKALVPYAMEVGFVGAGFLLLFVVLSMLVTRYLMSPLTALARHADEVVAGKVDRRFPASGVIEARQISSMLNLIVEELQAHRSRITLDNQLLSLQVDERNQQLERRNKDLSKAVAQVTEAKDRLRRMAYYDSLTSLPNRQLFIEQLGLLLRVAQREKKKLALMFVDLDNFKRINDSLGHSVGDRLLKEVATRLTEALRSSDVVGSYVDAGSKIGVSRLGGDEFTVVLNNIDRYESAGVVAERLIETLRKPMHIEGHELVITPSIGIAVAPRDAQTLEDMLKLSDMAMYHAKTTGRNKFTYYTSAIQTAGVGRLKMETDLRKALEREEFVLHFQPQVSTATGEIVGAEVLIRWNHPEQGLVPPFRFIPLAEEMGLIVELGAWTLVEACRLSRALLDQGLKVPKIAVNVSSLQFNSAFTNLVKKVLEHTRLEPSMLEIELTEGVIMSNAQASIDALHELKKLGVSISVDDFGTGYSSLNYLSRFPLDEIKIDRSFIVELDKGPAHSSLVSSIIALGQSLNLRLVAEGVDTVEQFRFLRHKNVEVIQGFLFSKPVPVEEFARLLKQNPFPAKVEAMTAAPLRALAVH